MASSSLIWGVTHDSPRILLLRSSACAPSLVGVCKRRRRRSLSVGSRNRGEGGFIEGFVLGGILAGTLTCIYAPQISEALLGATTKGSNKKKNNNNIKLPHFAHDQDGVDEEDDENNSNQNKVVDNQEEITRESIEAKIAEINAKMGINSSKPRYN